MPFNVKKRGDDVFLIFKRKKLTYSFDVLGKVLFAANKLYVGDKESSECLDLCMDDIRVLYVILAKNNLFCET